MPLPVYMNITLSWKVRLVVTIILVIISSICYAVCWYLENEANKLAMKYVDIVCVKYHEISEPVGHFLLYAGVPVLPDLAFAILGLFLWKLCRDPIGVPYNITMGILCILTSGYIDDDSKFVDCGNPDQKKIKEAASPLMTAGIIHIVLAVFTHLAIERGDGYFGFFCKRIGRGAPDAENAGNEAEQGSAKKK